MGDHDTPSGGLRHVTSLDTLSDGANLVDLEQEGIAELLVDTGLHSGGVGDEQVIADDLDLVSHQGSHFDVSLKIILIERIFN